MRLLFTLIALLVASTAWAQGHLKTNFGLGTDESYGKIQTYHFVGYDDQLNPTTTEPDTLLAGRQYIAPYFPVKGANLVVIEAVASSGSTSNISVQVAGVDTLGQNSITILTSLTGSISVNHGVYAMSNAVASTVRTITPDNQARICAVFAQGDDQPGTKTANIQYMSFKITASTDLVGLRVIVSVFCPDGGFQPAGDPVASTGPVYSSDSPWNTPISSYAVIHADSDSIISRMHLGSSDSQQVDLLQGFNATNDSYAMPIYQTSVDVDSVPVWITGSWYEVYDDETTDRWSAIGADDTFQVNIPIPTSSHLVGSTQNAGDPPIPSPGDDGHFIVWDPKTGDEWGLYKMNVTTNVTPVKTGYWARNGYHYNTRWDAIPPSTPDVFGSRGIGAPYMAGVIRRDEIRSGVIRHAIAFGAPDIHDTYYVCPATKTDGDTIVAYAMWAGMRIRLKDSFDIEGSSLTDAGKIVARAMRDYGMILADGSGSLKIYAEFDDGDADSDPRWAEMWSGGIINSIPFSAFEVIDTTGDCTP